MSSDIQRSESRRIALLGSGGHAKVIYDTLTSIGWSVVYVATLDQAHVDSGVWRSVPVLHDDEGASDRTRQVDGIANGIGFVGRSIVRQEQHERFAALGFDFPVLIHPSAVVSPSARLGSGAQVLHNAVLQADSQIGAGCIINTGASVDHDSVVGNHSHIAPGAVVCGDVSVGESTLIGSGATLVPGVKVGSGCRIDAGVTVTTDVPSGSRVRNQAARQNALSSCNDNP